jgi:hypothetical protein
MGRIIGGVEVFFEALVAAAEVGITHAAQHFVV